MSSASDAGLERAVGRALLRDAAADGWFVCTPDGRIRACNPAGARFLGRHRSSLPGASPLAVVEDQTTALRLLSAAAERRHNEFVVPTPQGEDCWTEVRVLSIPRGAVFILSDVTDRERSERALRRKEQRLLAANDSLRMAHKAARAASWEWRPARGMRWLDLGAARQLVGPPATWTEEDVVANWRELVVPADRMAVESALERMTRAGEATYEFRVLGADGRLHWLQSSGAVFERNGAGEPTRMAGVTLDITEAKSAEQALKHEIAERRRIEERQQLLLHELNHRVKNMLVTVQAIARRTFGRRGGGEAMAQFEDRLQALAWTHDVLMAENWVSASVADVLKRTLSPHANPDGPRIQLDGPAVQVSPRLAVALAMAAHELATNAVKYGALSVPDGVVRISWDLDERGLEEWLVLDWRESGGPPVEPPKSRGFGSRLIEEALSTDLGGGVRLTFEPSGVRCHLEARLQSENPEPLPLPSDRTSHAPPPSA